MKSDLDFYILASKMSSPWCTFLVRTESILHGLRNVTLLNDHPRIIMCIIHEICRYFLLLVYMPGNVINILDSLQLYLTKTFFSGEWDGIQLGICMAM